MKTIWIAAIDTRHWAFMAVGRTEKEAMLALEMGWKLHCLETGATIPWDELREDVGVRRVQLGDCLRNGQPMSEGM